MEKQKGVDWLISELKRRILIIESEPDGIVRTTMIDNFLVDVDEAKAIERELIKESCIVAIMQWHEWDKTNYLDLYDHKIEGAEIWAEDYCKELYEEIENL
jgi:hypothetical protein